MPVKKIEEIEDFDIEQKWKSIERYICSITKFHDLAEEIAPTRHPKVKNRLQESGVQSKPNPHQKITLLL